MRAVADVSGRERVDRPPCTRWRVLRDPPGDAAWNMAVDEALARSLTREHGVLRIYRWSRPTLSLGRNQPARDRYDPVAIRALGAEVVRRPTGGREVLHDRELTYCVVMPLRSLGGLRDAYRTLNGALLQALRTLGVPAVLAHPDHPTPTPDAGACFGAAADGEIEVEGRKLVGSAQVRIGGALLQHGSLPLAPSTLSLDAFRADGFHGRAPAGAAGEGGKRPVRSEEGTSLSEVAGEAFGFGTVAASVEAAMAGALGGRWARGELSEPERGLAVDLRPDYESPSRTWRR